MVKGQKRKSYMLHTANFNKVITPDVKGNTDLQSRKCSYDQSKKDIISILLYYILYVIRLNNLLAFISFVSSIYVGPVYRVHIQPSFVLLFSFRYSLHYSFCTEISWIHIISLWPCIWDHLFVTELHTIYFESYHLLFDKSSVQSSYVYPSYVYP